MDKIGVRELKNNLNKYLKRVKEGNSFIITEHNRSIALVEPLVSETMNDIFPLIESGFASWKGGKPSSSSSKIVLKGKKTAAELVIEERI